MPVELAYETIEGEQPRRTVAFLHGILGRGQNLRTIAKRFVEARPDWTAWLVDLRGHGRSPKGTSGAALQAAAQDVLDCAGRAVQPMAALVGHSFGGKVALEAVAMGPPKSLQHIVAIDSMPGAREPLREGDSALAIMDKIESFGLTFTTRTDFINALVGDGIAPAVAQWLAQSLDKEDDHVRFMLDLNEVRSLILDYFARDLWTIVESPPGITHIHLVIADRSQSYSPAARERARRIAAANDRVTVDVLPAGHWVHVDDPDGLLRVLVDRLGS